MRASNPKSGTFKVSCSAWNTTFHSPIERRRCNNQLPSYPPSRVATLKSGPRCAELALNRPLSSTLSENKLDFSVYGSREKEDLGSEIISRRPFEYLRRSHAHSILTGKERVGEGEGKRAKNRGNGLLLGSSHRFLFSKKAHFFLRALAVMRTKGLLKNLPLFPFVLHSRPNCICRSGRVIRHFNKHIFGKASGL